MVKKSLKPVGERTLLGFDFGSKSIGVAVGQEITASANPLQALKAQNGIPDWNIIEALVSEWQPDLMVVGLPLNMDGTPQHTTYAAKKFANRLQHKFNIEVQTQDERLTTADARAQLFAQGGYRNLKKGNVDNLSAKLILESWFEAQFE